MKLRVEYSEGKTFAYFDEKMVEGLIGADFRHELGDSAVMRLTIRDSFEADLEIGASTEVEDDPGPLPQAERAFERTAMPGEGARIL